ncbi:MAG: hypothetical protein EOO46_13315 [Flavobacterium sp.]|nr:MAG: hypothetical protein EOO46_13315 [Flavobacterium sp.]
MTLHSYPTDGRSFIKRYGFINSSSLHTKPYICTVEIERSIKYFDKDLKGINIARLALEGYDCHGN